MSTLGNQLREAREAKRITLATVSAKTRIPEKYLEALEGDQYGIFPSQTHAKGFLRAYAKVVGLDPALVTGLFQDQVEPAAVKIKPPNPEGEIPSGFSFPFLKRPQAAPRRERLSDESFDPDVPADEPGQVLRTQEKPEPRVRVPMSLKMRARLSGALVLALAAGLVFLLSPWIQRFTGNWHWPAVGRPFSGGEAALADIPAPAIKDKYQHLILKGLDQSWILVTMDGGKETSEIDLAAGEVKNYKAQKDFKLKIGNAGGVDVRFNGRPLGVLGTTGQVVELTLDKNSGPN